VEKSSEIGVSRLVPLLTARTIIKPSKQEANERWKRIALAASKQCGRPDVMDVTAPKTLSESFKELPKDQLALIPWEKENATTIQQACQNRHPLSVQVFIGPEGGWESQEVELAVLHGAIPVRLGPTLLRSETAGLVAATLVLSELGVYS
jgi:16S rRNA (uracil1498-N3)-methyltransferase